MSFIEKLQNKPRYIRVQILWISVILTMIIIILLWLFFLSSSLGPSKNKEKFSQEKQSIPSLFETLKEDFSTFKKSLETSIDKLLKQDSGPEFEAEIIKPLKLPE